MSKLFRKRAAMSASVSTAKVSEKKSFKEKLNNFTKHWSFKKITVYFVTFGLIIGLITSWVWYQKMYMTPERRFYSALNNSMATSSVVRTLTQGGSGNEVVQNYRFHFAPQRVVENTVSYSEISSTVNTNVKTEGIIYPTEQFLRYTDYSSTGQDAANLNLDAVLDQWANEKAENEDDAALNYLSEQVTLAIFGNFDDSFRSNALQQMKDKQIYTVNYDNVRTDKFEDEDVTMYVVSVKLKAYAALLNESFQIAGYGEFPPLNPDNYTEDATVNAQFMVRSRDNVIIGISFGGREERYSNYGVQKTVQHPTAVRTLEELQANVQQLFESQQTE